MTKTPQGQIETTYREIELRYAPGAQLWITPFCTFKTPDEAMVVIDKHVEDERRISVPVIVSGWGELKKAEAVLMDGGQVWIKLESGRRAKENMGNVFFADDASRAEYKKINDAIKIRQKEIEAIKVTRDALHVTPETLLAAHKAAKAGG